MPILHPSALKMDTLAFRNKKILVVDDSPVEVEFITSILSPLGCQIATAPNGKVALTKLNAHKFDLVLLDIILPDMDGFTIIDKMQSDDGLKDIPTIFLSALSKKDQVVVGISKGAVDYISKPFYPEELIQRINVHLRLREATQTLISEFKKKTKVENILLEQEELFHNYFKNAPFVQIISSLETDLIIDVNEEFEKHLGFSRAEVLGKSSTELFVTVEQRNKVIEEVEKNGFLKNYEGLFIDKNGNEHTGTLSFTQYLSLGKRYLLTTGVDTTNQRLLEKEIENKEQTLKNIALNIPLPFSSANIEGVIEFCNSPFTKLFGYTIEDIPTIEIWFKKAYPDSAYRELIKQRWIKSLEVDSDKGPQPIEREYNITCKDGKIRVVEIFSIHNKDNIYSLFKDITAEKEINLQIKKLSEAVYQSPSSVVITDIHGNIEFVNPKFTEVTGYTAENVLGKNPRVLKSDKMPKEFYENMWTTIYSGKTWHGEFLNKNNKGELYWEDATIAPIFDDNKKIINFIAIKENITEIKLALEALKKSELALKEANATKDKFFSIIAHDLRGPIGTISGLAELLVSDPTSFDESQQHEFIRAIYQSSNSTFNLLDNLLNWAKSQAGKLTVNKNFFAISDTVLQAIEPLVEQANKKHIKISNNVSSNIHAYGDHDLFTTALRNLVSNAIKFTRQNGEIRIFAKDFDSYVEISIEDNGVGIDAEHLNHIFKLGKGEITEGTEKEIGTGMGLLIVKEFVEKNGGEIWVESRPNEGSNFTFSIPKMPLNNDLLDLK